MNWSEMQGHWKGMCPVLKSYWSKLTEKDLARIKGDRAALASALRRYYGYREAEAETAIAQFEKDVRFPGAAK
jgi:uncharacterized protein YjbJ (UPF0337 family)